MRDWAWRCPHHPEEWIELPRLAEGSEHLVLYRESDATVIKVTRPGTFGDYYYLRDGRVFQEKATPAEYLARLRWWDALFGAAPTAFGITDDGRILSTQPYITGVPPDQESVDQFLRESGLEGVMPRCFLWKRTQGDAEIWVGDTRDENFLHTARAMVPIDIRVWLVERSGVSAT